jgi:hypothetical protein
LRANVGSLPAATYGKLPYYITADAAEVAEYQAPNG